MRPFFYAKIMNAQELIDLRNELIKKREMVHKIRLVEEIVALKDQIIKDLRKENRKLQEKLDACINHINADTVE